MVYHLISNDGLVQKGFSSTFKNTKFSRLGLEELKYLHESEPLKFIIHADTCNWEGVISIPSLVEYLHANSHKVTIVTSGKYPNACWLIAQANPEAMISTEELLKLSSIEGFSGISRNIQRRIESIESEVNKWKSELKTEYWMDINTLKLSPRQSEIIQLVKNGYSNKQIARKLGISTQTVKNHITATLIKLSSFGCLFEGDGFVNDRVGAVKIATELGYLY